jgi:hypothetical protein
MIDGKDLPVVDRPALCRPKPPLAKYVEFFGYRRHRGSTYRSRALPRGYFVTATKP